MTEPRSLPPGGPDHGHLLPEDVWATVVADAEHQARRIAAGHPPDEAPDESGLRGLYGTGVLVPLAGAVIADSNGGRRPRGWPTFGVLHDAETPLSAGYASSLARNWFGPGGGAPTSCHYITDPAEIWGVLPDELIAWHCGNGNINSLGLEQAGYASFTRAQWLSPAGWAQMRNNAAVMRAAKARYGIGTYWMTDQQLRDAHAGRIVGGWATHAQCARVLGGTTHTDPEPNFPLVEQMQLANGVTEEPDMDAGQAAQLTAVYDTLTGGKAGVKYAGDVWAKVTEVHSGVKALQASNAALTTTVQALAAAVGDGQQIDVPALLSQVDATVRKALEESVVAVAVDVRGPLQVSAQRMDELPDRPREWGPQDPATVYGIAGVQE